MVVGVTVPRAVAEAVAVAETAAHRLVVVMGHKGAAPS